MSNPYSSIESSASQEYQEMSLGIQCSSLRLEGQEKPEGSSSSTQSSLVVANFHALKANLNDMMSNLSEMKNFLDNEEANIKKDRPTSIPHPYDVCDASKSDEMKLNEILNLLHHLTRTLTAYERSPLLAEIPSCNDNGSEITQGKQRGAEKCDQAAQNNGFNESKSLRSEIDGIIQRKEALDEKMESFRKNSTAASEYELKRKREKDFSDSTGTSMQSHGGLDDLKRQDELLGLSDGGLSGEINSLGETIQHLLKENRNFRSFFSTIASHDQFGLRENDNRAKNDNYLSGDENLSTGVTYKYENQSNKHEDFSSNHIDMREERLRYANLPLSGTDCPRKSNVLPNPQQRSSTLTKDQYVQGLNRSSIRHPNKALSDNSSDSHLAQRGDRHLLSDGRCDTMKRHGDFVACSDQRQFTSKQLSGHDKYNYLQAASSDNISHRQSCSDNISNKQPCSDNIIHRQSYSDNINDRQSYSDNISHGQLCSDNRNHMQSYRENISHRQSYGDNISHRQSFGDNTSHRQSCSVNEFVAESAVPNITTTSLCLPLHADTTVSSKYNKLEAVGSRQQSENKFPTSLAQIYEVEGKVNFLMKEALTLMEVLQVEKTNLAQNDPSRGDNCEAGSESLTNKAIQLKELSEEICSNISQPCDTKDTRCISKTCRCQRMVLKKQNKLLQKQLSLQIGLTALISGPSSKTSDSSPRSQGANNCSERDSQKQSSRRIKTNDANSSLDQSSKKEPNRRSNLSTPVTQEIIDVKKEASKQEENNEHTKITDENINCIKLQRLLTEERLRGQLWFAAENVTAMRLSDVEQRLRKVKQSKRELQAKYKTLRQSQRMSLQENNNNLSRLPAKSEKSYEIMLSTLGRNIGIAAEIVSSHLYFSRCGIHPSPELTDDPSFWFAAQCSRLRWLQGQLRQLCIRNWKNTEMECGDNESTDGTETLTSQCGHRRSSNARETSVEKSSGISFARHRRLSLPEYGHVPYKNLFPHGSWSHLNINQEPILPHLRQLVHVDERDTDTLEREFSNSTFDGISELSAGAN